MKNTVHIKLINKPHPFPGSAGSAYEAWGRIIIFHSENEMLSNLYENENHVFYSENDNITKLYDWEWNIMEFAEWFFENEKFISEEILDVSYLKLERSISLAESLQKLHDRDFDPYDEDGEFDWFNGLYEYYTHHNLLHGFYGARRIPDFIIGMNNGSGEISKYTDEEKWYLDFDMAEFLSETKQELIKFLIFGLKSFGFNIISDKINLRMNQYKTV